MACPLPGNAFPSRPPFLPSADSEPSPPSSAVRLLSDSDSDDGDAEPDAVELLDLERGRWRRGNAKVAPVVYTAADEAAVVRRLDRRLVLFVALLYMLSFLDRSNIGNARIAGLEADLAGGTGWYESALTAFYLSYIGFGWMSMLWRLVPAHVYVAALVAAWGCVASLQAVSPSWPVLVALRFSLGIAEAGFSGIPLFLSTFFRHHELAFRMAIFIAAAPLASSFASSLAWLIVRLSRNGPIAPWRLLFLVEGFPSVIAAVVAWHIIPDSPQTAWFLTRREQAVATQRLRTRHPASSMGSRSTLGSSLAVLRDPAAWLMAAMFFLANMAYSSFPVFLPTILTQMGHGALDAQALSAPPYLVALVSVLVTARQSDRLQSRSVPVALHGFASAVAYGALGLADPLALGGAARYLAVVVAAAGFFSAVAVMLAWAVNSQAGQTRQGVGFALLQVVGQCGPLVGTRLYPDADAPFYVRGMLTCAAAMLAVALLALALRSLLSRRNTALDAEESRNDGAEDADELDADGLDAPPAIAPAERFRYML